MAMSPQEQLNPYLSRFTTLVQQHASAKLEFSCMNGKVTVNLMHDLGVVEKASPAKTEQQTENGPVLRKNLSLSQIIRLKNRAAARAEKAKLEADHPKARNEAEKAISEDVHNTEAVEAKAKT